MNHKRRRPRTQSTHNYLSRNYDNSPRWWDVLCNRRPARRRAAALIRDLKHGRDPDAIAWDPAGKPHNYYW